MRLSADPFKLVKMAEDELRDAILERRAALRAHRDAKLDDRCWVDDYLVWDFVEGSPPDLSILPGEEEAMGKCRDFHKHRGCAVADARPADALSDPMSWDEDLRSMKQPQLAKTLAALQAAIRTHRDVKDRPRAADDDRALYAVLPEKLPADFRLPSEEDFLGEAGAPHAGCPSFWRSHKNCAGRHNLHRWGPCDGT